MFSERKQVLLGLALCCLPIAVTLVIFGPALWDSGTAILFRDIGTLTLPNKSIIVDSLRRFGELPGWNPFVLGGAPFLADPSTATYYPLNAVFLLFPRSLFPFAHSWYLAVHIPLTFAGFFLFFRLCGGPKFFAAIAALSIAAGGCAVSSFYMSGTLGGILSAGWLFYFWARFLQERRSCFLFPASFFLVLPIYSGDPQFSYMLAIFFVPGFTLLQESLKRSALDLASLFFLGFLAGAPQLLPALDLLKQSVREGGVALAGIPESWSLHPLRLVELFLPLPFGNSFYGNPFSAPYVNGMDTMPFLFSIYPGFFALPALLAAVVQRGKNSRAFYYWLALCGVLLLAAMGSYSPLPLNFWLSKALPLWSSFRFPERLMTYFQLALFLGLAEAFRDWDLGVFFRRFAFAALSVGAAGLVAVAGKFPSPEAAGSFAFPSAALLIMAILFLSRRAPLAPLLALLVFVSALDLGSGMRKIVYKVPAKITSADWIPLVGMVEQQWGKTSLENFPRVLTEDEQSLNWQALDSIGAGKLGTMGKLALHQWLMLSLDTGSYFQIGTPLGFTTLMEQRHYPFWNVASGAGTARALSLKGTNFIARMEPRGNFSLQRNPAALPLFSLPLHVDFVGSELAALRKIGDPSWDWRSRIALQGEGDAGEISARGALSFTVENRTYNKIVLRVRAGEASREGWVLWNETFDRFWTASISGNELPLRQANFWASAFKLPSLERGETLVVQLVYENPAAKLGQALFLVWVLMAGLAVSLLVRIDNFK